MAAAVLRKRSIAQYSRAAGGEWYRAALGALFGACVILCIASAVLLVYRSLPELQAGDARVLQRFPPRTLGDLKAQRDVLLAYAATSPGLVLCGFCCCYVLLQTCAVPGTLSLSLLAGALYGWCAGLVLVAVVSTVGSCSCYALSRLVGRWLVHALWPRKIEQYAAEVQRRRADLLNYVIFLRVTPVLPNTFVNVASPIVGVPLAPFMLGTLLGCLPNNMVAVSAGSRLSELESLSDLYDPRMLLVGGMVGLASLVPVYLKHRARGARGLPQRARSGE